MHIDNPTIVQAMINGLDIILKALHRGENTIVGRDMSGVVSNLSSIRGVYDLTVVTPSDSHVDILAEQPTFYAIEITGKDQREYEVRPFSYNPCHRAQ